MIHKHGGNLKFFSDISGLPVEDIVDFSANINPLGPPEWFRSFVSSTVGSLVNYPDPDCDGLIEAASKRYACGTDQVIAGNGSTELLRLIPRALAKSRAIIPVPSYSDYVSAVTNAGMLLKTLPLRHDAGFGLDFSLLESELTGDDLVILCNPNNPTGHLLDSRGLRELALRNPSCYFLIDEAFGDFVKDFDSLVSNRPRNVMVLLSLTKIYAAPGLRLGLAVADPDIIASLLDTQPTWSVNSIAQGLGQRALSDFDYLERTREYVAERRAELAADLGAIPGLTIFPAAANFVLVRIDRPDINARMLAEKLMVSGIAIRVCDNFQGLNDRFFRLAVRTEDENQRLLDSMKPVFGVSVQKLKRKTPAIMFQGISSNAGKSVLTAAMCRILLQDGFKVAPFKAQNMSLNSFVTRDGGEMGRAQVVQAQACKLDPDVRMNPILLKPNSDTGSQVIVCGQPVGNMDVNRYIAYKPQAFGAVKEAYDSLASEFDVVVLEGAGSPAEVNLKHHDIVNMNMARYAKAPVMLVGDIDRGGVFASFVGTMEVLAEWERALVAGFVINKFRGNVDLLADAIEFTQRHTGKPTFGIVPYFHNLGLPEEDSVSFKSGMPQQKEILEDSVEIAVIDLPHISNFTDFDAFSLEPDVNLKIVRSAQDLNQPDVIILPGTKNTIGDLEYLKSRGLVDRIRMSVHENGTELVGICGGFQMIGSGIADPHRLETDGKTIEGLGFLDVVTVLAKEKTLTRFSGTHIQSGLPVHGYEIHHGRSENAALEPVIKNSAGGFDGAGSGQGTIWGTYVHGVFDADEFRRWFIDKLRVRKGLAPKRRIMSVYNIETALDSLADTVRKTMDIESVYKLLGL